MTTEEFLKICGVRVSKGSRATGGRDYVSNWDIQDHPLYPELRKWLWRQTTSFFGPWPDDVASFFRQKLKGIETPVCLD